MANPLPSNLGYLDSVISELGKLDPDSLGDDNPRAIEIVDSAVRARVKGMDEDQAKAAILQDCSDLERWLEQPGLEASPGHYVYGALFGTVMWADFGELAG